MEHPTDVDNKASNEEYRFFSNISICQYMRVHLVCSFYAIDEDATSPEIGDKVLRFC